jgi:hypothetical protein
MWAAIRTFALTLCFMIVGLNVSDASPELDAPATGVQLLSRVRALVDQGQLLDPISVARVLPSENLGTTIDQPAIRATPEGACNPGLQKAFKRTRLSFAAWFHNQPTGIPNLPYRAVGPFGHAGITGDPAGSYVRSSEEYCSDLLHLPEEATATLRFENLPGFSCLTMDDVASVMPVTDDHATDGGGIYSYSPPAQKEYGTRITFFFGGSRCLGGVMAEQSQKWGTRYRQAQAAFGQCTAPAEHEFCATHPPFGWGDGAMLDLELETSAKVCRGFGSWYRAARVPDPSRPLPKFNVSPCGVKTP